MIANQDITVLNLRTDKVTRREVYIPTNISEVFMRDVRRSDGSASDRSEDLSFIIRIPISARVQECRTYIPEDKYRLLDDEQARKHWTLQKGCYIITGTLYYNDDWKFDDFDFSSGVITSSRLREFLDLQAYTKEIINVTEYTDNTRIGSDAVKHWRVGGK